MRVYLRELRIDTHTDFGWRTRTHGSRRSNVYIYEVFTAGAAERACLGERGDTRKRRETSFTLKAHSERVRDKG